jgi:hypothetical protein
MCSAVHNGQTLRLPLLLSAYVLVVRWGVCLCWPVYWIRFDVCGLVAGVWWWDLETYVVWVCLDWARSYYDVPGHYVRVSHAVNARGYWYVPRNYLIKCRLDIGQSAIENILKSAYLQCHSRPGSTKQTELELDWSLVFKSHGFRVCIWYTWSVHGKRIVQLIPINGRTLYSEVFVCHTAVTSGMRHFHYKLDLYYNQTSLEDRLITGFELLVQTTGVEELCFVGMVWTVCCWTCLGRRHGNSNCSCWRQEGAQELWFVEQLNLNCAWKNCVGLTFGLNYTVFSKDWCWGK